MAPRWTFTSAFLASAHCLSASLRPPGFACFQSSLVGIGTPSLILWFFWKPGAEATGLAVRLIVRQRAPLSTGFRLVASMRG